MIFDEKAFIEIIIGMIIMGFLMIGFLLYIGNCHLAIGDLCNDIPNNSISSNISMNLDKIHYSPQLTLPEGCYENETGQDPNDLVMHVICPKDVFL